MKNSIGRWALTLLTCWSFGSVASAYTLYCRAGGEHRAGFSNDYGAFIRFTRGTGPASAGLLEGQCTWGDRGFRVGEPDRLCKFVSAYYISFSGQYYIQPELKSVISPEAESLWRLFKLSANSRFTFEVTNDNKGCLRVTSP